MPCYGKILITGPAGPGAEFTIEGEAYESLLCWQPRAGEAVTVVAPGGRIFRARVRALSVARATLVVFEESRRAAPHGAEITLLQALPEKERMELVIEKATELGAALIQPFTSARSTTVAERDSAQQKSHRWQARALKAARQSRRPDIPRVLPCISFDEALAVADEAAGETGLRLLLSEDRDAAALKEAIAAHRCDDGVRRAVVMTGPEGGLTPAEAARAVERGFVPVSLGPRILRTETASIAAVGIVAYELGC